MSKRSICVEAGNFHPSLPTLHEGVSAAVLFLVQREVKSEVVSLGSRIKDENGTNQKIGSYPALSQTEELR